MSRIGVNAFSSMDDAAGALEQKSRDYEELAQQFKGVCQNMQGDVWQGSDSDTFIVQVDKLVNSMNSLAEKFRTEAKIIRDQKTDYEARQKKVQGDAGNLAN